VVHELGQFVFGKPSKLIDVFLILEDLVESIGECLIQVIETPQRHDQKGSRSLGRKKGAQTEWCSLEPAFVVIGMSKPRGEKGSLRIVYTMATDGFQDRLSGGSCNRNPWFIMQ